MNTDELKIEHRGIQMNVYKIKTYDAVRICCENIIVESRKKIWIGYECRYGEYVIYVANPCEIQHAISTISKNITLIFIHEKSGQTLDLCCDCELCAITFDQKKFMWKICISAVQSEFVKCALHGLFDDAHSAWLHAKIGMSSFYGLSSNVLGRALLEDSLPEIKDVIFNPPATIVFWEDGTKTVVKARKEGFDCEKGLAMAITKKALGNEGRYYETIKKWMMKGKFCV